MTYRAAVIGAGAPPEDDDTPGFAIGYAHGTGYREHGECDLVAVADLVSSNAEAYAAEFGIESERVYEDYREMIREIEPTIVSVCTPPEVHADVVVGCARQGIVDAVHCEKPMALTWSDCRLMVQECWRHDVQLTVNHQRRFAPRWHAVRERIDAGEIGEVRRVEMTAPDLLDWGTHCFDLCGYYAGDRPAEWVIGQVNEAIAEYYGGAYDHHTESQALGLWEYDDGVHGIASTGEGTEALGGEVFHRVRGTEGTIEVDHREGARLRRHDEGEWTDVAFEEASFEDAFTDAIDDALTGLETGREPELSAKKALNATELIYGIWESARRRGRVDLPLDVDDNPLEAMIDAGELPVRDAE